MLKNKFIEVKDQDYQLAIDNGYNEDLAPLVEEKRQWNLFNFFTLWMGSVHNVPNYVAVGGFLFLGMKPIHVVLALVLSSFFVMALLILNGMAGYRYGIPSTLLLRSTYGSRGAKLPGILRGIVAAIMWYGLQTYAGSQALLILIGKIFPDFLTLGGDFSFLGISLPGLIAFAIFWVINLMIGLGGGETISKFTAILNPIIYIVFGGMLIWAIKVAGISNILNYESGVVREHSGLFIYLMIISSVMSVWSAPGVSSSDFGRNAKDYRSLVFGQGLGLFIAYLLFAFSSVFIIIGATIHYQTELWNVLDIIDHWDNFIAIAFALGALLMTTISTNATGNIIPAGYQLSTLFPKKINFKKGVILASVISFLIAPWKLMENQDSIYFFLSIIGAIMGPVTGVMISHYYFIIKEKMTLSKIYGKDEIDIYTHDINVPAYIATIAGVVVALSFQFIPAVAKFADVSWFISFFVSFIIYRFTGKPNKEAVAK